MSLDSVKSSIEKLQTSDITSLINWLMTYHDERINRDRYAPEAEAAAIKQAQEDGVLEMPDALKVAPRDVEDAPEWANPVQGGTVHLHQCYHEGDIIQHDGKLWRSVYPHLNRDVPGASELWVQIEPAVADSE